MTIGNSLWTNSAMIVMICWSSSRCWRAIVKLQRWNSVQIHVVFVDWSLGWYRCWSSTLMMMINKGKLLSYSLFPLFFPPLVKNILLGLAYWAMEAQSGIQLVYYTTKSQQDDIVIYTTRSTYPSSMTRSSIAKSCCLRSWTSSLLCLLHCCTLFMSKVSISVNNKHTNLVTHTFFLHFRCFAFQCRILGP